MMATDDPIDWLMAGDPAIRWQALRDLLGAPEREWKAEQRRTLEGGWGARLLALQEPNGDWGGGIYSPKWTSATYTLLTLRSIGIPRECEAAQRGARRAEHRRTGVGDASGHARSPSCWPRIPAGRNTRTTMRTTKTIA